MPFHGVDILIVLLLELAIPIIIIYRIVKFIGNYATRRLQAAESLQNEVAALRAEVHALREERDQ